MLLLKKGARVATVDIHEADLMDFLCRLMPERAAGIISRRMRTLLPD